MVARTLFSKLRGTALAACFAGAFAVQAQAMEPAAEGRRLIETGPGVRRWLTEQEIHEISRKSHEEGHCGGYKDVTDRPELEPEFFQPLEWFAPARLEPTHPDVVEPLIASVSRDQLQATVTKLSSFPNRYYANESGVAAAQWIRDQFALLGRNRTDISVTTFAHNFRQPSVIARMEGSGPNKDEVIVIGAHLDSINQGFGWPNPQGSAPGADDDASGVATVIEVFRVLTASGFRPNRTIEFMGYAGEERGLLGSQDVVAHYRQAGKRVVGVMHFDMTMFPGTSKKITFITDHVNPLLTAFGKKLVERYLPEADWAESTCGYACSDHASWDSAGYPAVYPFEAPFEEYNKKIHTPNDLIGILDLVFGTQFARLGVAFAVEMSL